VDGSDGLTYTDSMTVAVVAPLRIGLSTTGTNLLLQVNTRAGRSYILETASELDPLAVWTPILTNMGNGAAITNFVPLDQPLLKQFFRYKEQ
jgi:hypothetical protein